MTDWQSWQREANYIGGAWVQADSGKVIAVTNPATGEVSRHVAMASRQTVEEAIAAGFCAAGGRAAAA